MPDARPRLHSPLYVRATVLSARALLVSVASDASIPHLTPTTPVAVSRSPELRASLPHLHLLPSPVGRHAALRPPQLRLCPRPSARRRKCPPTPLTAKQRL
ncbi:hypothetical protein ACJRO7_024145 [Eucalyptus globulus]|uniref:Uncharacterized protein n=1 Tax=Eucalyptus globulus TaxID=34317 RepID=A0ABD3KGZ2_EUCGL